MRAIQELLLQFPVVAVLGPRQAGKTTLCRALVTDDWTCVDLEDDRDRDRVANDPGFFLEQHPDRLLVDEAQELPQLFRALRVAVDRNRKTPGRFLITGSSSPALTDQVSESLAGRVATFELGPLRAAERCGQPSIFPYSNVGKDSFAAEILSLGRGGSIGREQLEFSWLVGGYPEPALLDSSESRALWFQNYQRTYVQRDIRRLFPRLNIDRPREAFRKGQNATLCDSHPTTSLYAHARSIYARRR